MDAIPQGTMIGAFLAGHFLFALRQPREGDIPIRGYAPIWIRLGTKPNGTKTWLRLQQHGDHDYTDAAVYADGRVVSKKGFSFQLCYPDAPDPVAAQVGNDWIVFVNWDPGTTCGLTECEIIDRRTFRVVQQRSLTYGDATRFPKTHEVVEFKLTKFQDRPHNVWKRYAFDRMVWRWDREKRRLRRVSSRLTNHLGGIWGSLYAKPGWETNAGWRTLIVKNLGPFGLPKGSMIRVGQKGDDRWITLCIGRRGLARLDLDFGELEWEVRPTVKKSVRGPVLSFAAYDQFTARRYDVLISQRPYKLTLLGSRLVPEWTPFGRAK